MEKSSVPEWRLGIHLDIASRQWQEAMNKNFSNTKFNWPHWLALSADCNACHRGADKGAPDYSVGVVLATPMGSILGSNITPSKQYGIGLYAEADFKCALTQGIRRDGKHLYPAIPLAESA